MLKAFGEGGETKELGKNKIWWRMKETEESRQTWVLILRDGSTVALCTPNEKADVTQENF